MKAVKGFPERCELQINRERVFCWFPFISFVHNCFEGKNDFKNTVLSWKHLYLHTHWGKESCKLNCVLCGEHRMQVFQKTEAAPVQQLCQRPTPRWCGASTYPWSRPMKHTQEPQDTHALACPRHRLGYFLFLSFYLAVCQEVIISYQNCKMVLSSEWSSNHLSYF